MSGVREYQRFKIGALDVKLVHDDFIKRSRRHTAAYQCFVNVDSAEYESVITLH